VVRDFASSYSMRVAAIDACAFARPNSRRSRSLSFSVQRTPAAESARFATLITFVHCLKRQHRTLISTFFMESYANCSRRHQSQHIHKFLDA